jgi:hypothetical protein
MKRDMHFCVLCVLFFGSSIICGPLLNTIEEMVMVRVERPGDLTVGTARVGATVVCVKLPEHDVQQELAACGCKPLERFKRYVVKANSGGCKHPYHSPAFVKLEGCDQVAFPHNLFDPVL